MATLGPPHTRKLDSREEKLDTLLVHYVDAQDTLYSGNSIGGGGGGDGGCGLMPLVWNMSYRELERCLKRMRVLSETPGAASPGLRASYVHLGEWYLRARRKRVPLMRKDKKGKLYHVTTASGPQYKISVIREGDPVAVLRGLEWIASEFVGEIYLPSEFLTEGVAA